MICLSVGISFFKIWDTDKQDFVFRQYKGLNKYKTLSSRRKAAKEKIEEIKKLIVQGYTAGRAKVSLKEYDIRRLTFRQVVRHPNYLFKKIA